MQATKTAVCSANKGLGTSLAQTATQGRRRCGAAAGEWVLAWRAGGDAAVHAPKVNRDEGVTVRAAMRRATSTRWRGRGQTHCQRRCSRPVRDACQMRLALPRTRRRQLRRCAATYEASALQPRCSAVPVLRQVTYPGTKRQFERKNFTTQLPRTTLDLKSLCGGGVPSSHPSLGLSVFFLSG